VGSLGIDLSYAMSDAVVDADAFVVDSVAQLGGGRGRPLEDCGIGRPPSVVGDPGAVPLVINMSPPSYSGRDESSSRIIVIDTASTSFVPDHRIVVPTTTTTTRIQYHHQSAPLRNIIARYRYWIIDVFDTRR
jgi:hypothetical protein